MLYLQGKNIWHWCLSLKMIVWYNYNVWSDYITSYAQIYWPYTHMNSGPHFNSIYNILPHDNWDFFMYELLHDSHNIVSGIRYALWTTTRTTLKKYRIYVHVHTWITKYLQTQKLWILNVVNVWYYKKNWIVLLTKYI